MYWDRVLAIALDHRPDAPIVATRNVIRTRPRPEAASAGTLRSAVRCWAQRADEIQVGSEPNSAMQGEVRGEVG
jgi:hypothetical protein